MGSANVRVLVVAGLVSFGSGCKSDSPIDPLERAATISAASAVALSGVVGTPAPSAPAVRVTDTRGDPVSGVQVSFSVTPGSGSVSPSLVTTDADGRATTTWTLGTAVRTYTLTASVGNLSPVVFTATTVAGPPSTLERMSLDSQIVAVGSVAGLPLSVRVTDSFQNPVSGVAVSFNVVSGGGTISPANAMSDRDGFVSATWTVGPTVGLQTAQAQIAGIRVLFTAEAYNCAAASDAAPCLGAVIFVSTSDSQIYRVNVDGTGLTRLTSEGNNGYPAWSPDGKRIAFTRSSQGATDLYLMNADGSNVVRRTTSGEYYSVTWFPDGSSLAASVPSGGDSLNIVTMSADGAEPPKILMTNAASPSWSPDGKQIAFIRGTGYYDPSQVYVSNADGTNAHRATPDSVGYNWGVAWSPDGKKLAFNRCAGLCGIYTMDLSSSVITLTSAADGSQDAAWSPDGRWLALTRYSIGAASISYVPLIGGSPRLIFSNASHPSWKPVTP